MAAQSRTPAGELYVHRIDELREEIGHAMAAISNNRLRAFEESLWRQEVLCAGLKHMIAPMQDAPLGTTLSTALQVSLSALHELNRSYAELLRQAQLSNRLLQTVCESHATNTPGVSTSRCSLEA